MLAISWPTTEDLDAEIAVVTQRSFKVAADSIGAIAGSAENRP
jgi:hypothetical protein